MPSLSAIKSDISTLSSIQITDLFEYIGQLITINSMEKDLQKDCKEKHFSYGQVCSTCGSLHVIKNGKVNGKQIKLRGISHEQVCVSSAIDRSENIVLECVCMGRISSSNLIRAYNGKIANQSIILIM